MGKRILFLFFIVLPVCAAPNNRQNIIPPVMVKRVQPTNNRPNTSGPQTIITRAQIMRANMTNFTQVLQNLGGVQLQNIVGNDSQVGISMRGFGANSTSNALLLVNGVPITNPDLASPDLNAIPLQDIEQVEIVAGSESVLYGDQAVGGIINVLTRHDITELGDISCSVGSYNQRNCTAGIHNRWQRLRYNITVARTLTDNYREHNHYDQNSLFGNFQFPYQSGDLHLDYRLARDDMQYPGALTAAQVRQDRRQASNGTDFFTNWNGVLHFNQRHQINENWHMQLNLARRQMQGNGVLFSDFTQSRLIHFFRPQLKGKIGHTELTTGGDFQSDSYRLNSQFGLTEESQQKFGLFGLGDFIINPKTILSFGARGAQMNSALHSTAAYNNINRAFTTTIGLTYHPEQDIDIYLRRAGSFRFPKADENASTPPGVTSLRTQRGYSYESGIALNKDSYATKIGIYQLNLDDEIAFDPTQTTQQPFGSNRNLAPTVRRGIIMSGKKQLTEKLALGGQYNYVNARFQSGINAGNRIPLVSENILRANIDYQFIDNMYTYIEAVYTGNQYAANDDANIAGKIGGYTVYNFNLHYDHKNLVTSLRVNNVFNKNYYFYVVTQTGSSPGEFFYPAPDRNIVLTVNYLFG